MINIRILQNPFILYQVKLNSYRKNVTDSHMNNLKSLEPLARKESRPLFKFSVKTIC